MKVWLNGKEVETAATSLTLLTEELALPVEGVAVAVNNRMVPRSQWADYVLTEGVHIVIIKAACGG